MAIGACWSPSILDTKPIGTMVSRLLCSCMRAASRTSAAVPARFASTSAVASTSAASSPAPVPPRIPQPRGQLRAVQTYHRMIIACSLDASRLDINADRVLGEDRPLNVRPRRKGRRELGTALAEGQSRTQEGWHHCPERSQVSLEHPTCCRTPPSSFCRYILRQMQYFRVGKPIQEIKAKPKKKYRGRVPFFNLIAIRTNQTSAGGVRGCRRASVYDECNDVGVFNVQ